MQIYRAGAKRDAWYDHDGPPNYNHFRKIHRRDSANLDYKQAGLLTAVGSEGNALEPIERRRRSQILRLYGQGGPALAPISTLDVEDTAKVDTPFQEIGKRKV